MSSTGVTIGYGTLVRVGRGATPTWTTLAGIGDVSFPEGKADSVDITHQASPGRAKEFINGLTDNGEVSIPVHWVPGSPTDILAHAIRGTDETVILEFTAANGGDAETFAAVCTAYTRTAPIGDKMAADLVFRVNGVVEVE